MEQQRKNIVELVDVYKNFHSNDGLLHEVLKGITFEVKQGEVVALIGPSGGGKSTCLRTINALETITSGRVKVCGEDYQTSRLPLHKLRRNTAMVFQRFELFPHLSALENVAIGPRSVLKKTRAESLDIAHDLLKRVGLQDHQNKYPRSLSGGQQQRVAIARALAIQPQVLLCDEPTSALDPELVDEVVDILADIASQGMTMIVVTHELHFAKKVSDRTLFLEGGVICEQGRTDDLFDAPQTERLRSFLKRITHAQ